MEDYDVVATEAYKNAKGTLTLTGGEYTFRDESEISVSDPLEVRAFDLKQTGITVGKKGIWYMMTDARGNEISFRGAADTGLNGKTVRWKFPEYPELNGQGKIPKFRSTARQLKDFVPYVELIRSAKGIAGVRWYFVKPGETANALKVPDALRVHVRVWDHTKVAFAYRNKWQDFKKGTIPQGTETFKTAIPEKDFCWVEVIFRVDDGRHAWRFSPRPESDEGIADRDGLAGPVTLKAGETRKVTVKMGEGFKLVPRAKKVLAGDGSILSAGAEQTDGTVTLSLKGLKPGRTTVRFIYYHDGKGDTHQRITTPCEVVVTD